MPSKSVIDYQPAAGEGSAVFKWMYTMKSRERPPSDALVDRYSCEVIGKNDDGRPVDNVVHSLDDPRLHLSNDLENTSAHPMTSCIAHLNLYPLFDDGARKSLMEREMSNFYNGAHVKLVYRFPQGARPQNMVCAACLGSPHDRPWGLRWRRAFILSFCIDESTPASAQESYSLVYMLDEDKYVRMLTRELCYLRRCFGAERWPFPKFVQSMQRRRIVCYESSPAVRRRGCLRAGISVQALGVNKSEVVAPSAAVLEYANPFDVGKQVMGCNFDASRPIRCFAQNAVSPTDFMLELSFADSLRQEFTDKMSEFYSKESVEASHRLPVVWIREFADKMEWQSDWLAGDVGPLSHADTMKLCTDNDGQKFLCVARILKELEYRRVYLIGYSSARDIFWVLRARLWAESTRACHWQVYCIDDGRIAHAFIADMFLLASHLQAPVLLWRAGLAYTQPVGFDGADWKVRRVGRGDEGPRAQESSWPAPTPRRLLARHRRELCARYGKKDVTRKVEAVPLRVAADRLHQIVDFETHADAEQSQQCDCVGVVLDVQHEDTCKPAKVWLDLTMVEVLAPKPPDDLFPCRVTNVAELLITDGLAERPPQLVDERGVMRDDDLLAMLSRLAALSNKYMEYRPTFRMRVDKPHRNGQGSSDYS